MPDYLSSYDYPLLHAAGFKPGIADTIYWKDSWQVYIEEDEMWFVKHEPDLSRGERVKLTRDEFGREFM